MPLITYRKFREWQSNAIAIILFLIGVILKFLHYFFFSNGILNWIADVLFISLSIGIMLELFIRRKDDVVLRDVLGISKNESLMTAIHSMYRDNEYITEKRESVWELFPNGKKMGIKQVDIHTIRVSKDNSDFYFRRGYDSNKTKLKDIFIDRKGDGNKFEKIDCSADFNQHLLDQKHGSHICYTLTNLTFKKNFRYIIKIITEFKECMSYEKDYLSVDFLNPTLKTEILIKFPFPLKEKGKDIFHFDAKIRSLSKFYGYIEPKILSGKKHKNNILQITYDKPLEGGDSIVIYYEKK